MRCGRATIQITLVYVLIIMFGFKKAEKQMAVLEEALAEQQGR